MNYSNYNPPVGYYDVPQNSANRGFSFSRAQSVDKTEEYTRRYSNKKSYQSAQLNSYAKPAVRLEQFKKRHTRSLSKPSVPDLDQHIQRATPHRGRLHKSFHKPQKEEFYIPPREVKKLKGQSIFDKLEELVTPKQKFRRRTCRTLFNLIPTNSLEQAQYLDRFKERDIPLQYEVKGCIQSQQVPWKYQCFSSTVKRFKEQIQDHAAVGTYDIQEPMNIKGPIPMDRQVSRQVIVKNNKIPPVGSYSVDIQKEIISSNNYAYPSPFGSGVRRF